jgi:6-phosphogluconolactonase
MIRKRLLALAPIPPGNVHPVPPAPTPVSSAEAYEGVIRAFFGLGPGEFPRFDLVLLGIGADGHTASLFPGDPGPEETERLTVAVGRAAPDHDRVSLTVPVINHARIIVFMVTGVDKSLAVRTVVADPPGSLPASRVRPAGGQAYLLLDSGAASRLAGRHSPSAGQSGAELP